MSTTVTEASFTNTRGLKIYTREYIPSTEFKTVFLFLHGVGEHCSRFEDFFQNLANSSIAVFAMDHQGHGKSEGERWDIDCFEHFLDDVSQFTGIIRNRFADRQLKYTIGGISFGGLLAANIASMTEFTWDGVLLLAPAIGVELNSVLKVQQSMAPLINKLVPKWKLVPAVIHDNLSRNKEFLKDYDEDALNSHGNLRVRLAYEISRGMEILKEREQNMTAPLLILHGDKDLVTSPRISKEFYDRVPSSQKSYRSLPGQFHCIVNEPEREENIAIMNDWLNAL
ncbi:alpha/beta-hydrolase [Thraustotheca clavata]|uniref:Alpha/beta-hydrolase n=1 Tax=Thraustotheca clavata TaxID=74557 RepID=A0A1W0AA35_9STRA|nr:alpha/beta-hydrolase [Thraustotheca clavata]